MAGLKRAQGFKIGSYWVFFWANENDPLEPVHVHVSKGMPSAGATKIWITKAGKCLLANNNSRIPDNVLGNIMDIIWLFTLFCGMGSSLQRCSNRIPWILQAPRAQCLQTHHAHNAYKRTILTTLTKLTITTKSSQSSVCSLQWSVQWRSRVCLS